MDTKTIDSSKVQKGDIFFMNDRSLISKAIRLVTTGRFGQDIPSHCGIITGVYYNHKEIILTIEAFFDGVKNGILNNRFKKNTHIWLVRLKAPREFETGLKWLDKQIFKKYDIPQITGILLRGMLWVIMAKLGFKSKPLKNFLDSKQKFICSELVENFAIKTGSRLWHGDISFVTPYDLYRSEEIKIYANLSFFKK